MEPLDPLPRRLGWSIDSEPSEPEERPLDELKSLSLDERPLLEP
jgi:hypothetical protein